MKNFDKHSATNIKKDKVATTLEDAIRGIIMFGVLGIFSWLSQ